MKNYYQSRCDKHDIVFYKKETLTEHLLQGCHPKNIIDESHLHDWGCLVHYYVLFSKEELKEHLDSGCHPENIKILPGKDPLGRIPFNWIARAIDAMDISEEEKKQRRDAELW